MKEKYESPKMEIIEFDKPIFTGLFGATEEFKEETSYEADAPSFYYGVEEMSTNS